MIPRAAPHGGGLALFLALLFCFLPESSPAALNSYVENGIPVPSSSPMARTVPFLTFSTGTYCSSSFLSERTLLTAGHCLATKSLGQVMVNVIAPDGKWHSQKAAALVVHPGYSLRKGDRGQPIVQNDLAIVQLKQAFAFPVRRAELSEPEGMAEGRLEAVTDIGYGYGSSKGDGRLLRYGKMSATLAVIDQFDFRIGLHQTKTAENQIVCPGDSGGPVMQGGPDSLKQIAVHSMSDGCTPEGSLSYSELVWPAREWIKAQIR